MDAFDRIASLGITLTLENGVLYASPSSQITEEVRGFIRDHKPELITALEAQPERICKTCGYLNTRYVRHYCMSPTKERFTLANANGDTCAEWVSPWRVGWREWNN